MAKRKPTKTKNPVKRPAQQPGNPIAQNMAMAFGTPIVAYPWPDSDALNEELKALILQKQSQASGMTRSNVGGWHSQTDIFSWEGDCIDTLRKRVEELTINLTRAITVAKEGKRTFQYRLDGWANVSQDGAYNSVHNHPNCLWSGVYYVSPGEPDPDRPNNGKLELLDPRAGIQLIHMEGTTLGARYVIDPIPGLMVMFPAWLNHMVHPFFGKGERISIAFNILTREAPSPQAAR